MFGSESVETMNELEKKLYSYILKNYDRVIYMTIRELSSQCGVSTTVTLNFCHKLNCDGYTEFRNKLKFYLEQQKGYPDSESLSEILGFFKIIRHDAFEAKILKAVNLINSKRHIIFVGTGTSGILARYGARLFSNIGKFSHYIDDPWHPVVSVDYQNELAIFLSVSGETLELINLAEVFIKNRCDMISISSSPTSTLSRISGLNISYHMPLKLIDNDFNITSQVPTTYILEVLSRKIKESHPS